MHFLKKESFFSNIRFKFFYIKANSGIGIRKERKNLRVKCIFARIFGIFFKALAVWYIVNEQTNQKQRKKYRKLKNFGEDTTMIFKAENLQNFTTFSTDYALK